MGRVFRGLHVKAGNHWWSEPQQKAIAAMAAERWRSTGAIALKLVDSMHSQCLRHESAAVQSLGRAQREASGVG